MSMTTPPNITALDYFAAAAMAGLLANPNFVVEIDEQATFHGVSRGEMLKVASYQLAQAMLAEKQKREGEKQ
jgi:hypothetical protein